MAKLISSVTTFIRAFAADMATMPRTKAAWPKLRTGAHEICTDLKNDFFNFQATRLNPTTGPATVRLNDALAQPAGAAKVERLLEAGEAADRALSKVFNEQDDKGGIFIYIMAAAMVAAALIGSCFAGLGGLVGLYATMALTAVPVAKMFSNRDKAGEDRRAIQEKVNSEILKIAATEPGAVFSSTAAQKILLDKGALKKAFSLGRRRNPDEQYAALAAQFPKPAAPAPQ